MVAGPTGAPKGPWPVASVSGPRPALVAAVLLVPALATAGCMAGPDDAGAPPPTPGPTVPPPAPWPPPDTTPAGPVPMVLGVAFDDVGAPRRQAENELAAREFGAITTENAFKMRHIQPARGSFDLAGVDALVEWARAEGLGIHGHALVWHREDAAWLGRWCDGAGHCHSCDDPSGAPWSRDGLAAALEEHVSTVVGHFEGRVGAWDVVNEPMADDGGGLRHTCWLEGLGDGYVELALRAAAEADPEARLFVSEYAAVGSGAKAEAFYRLVADLVDRGVPLQGVGLQMHTWTAGGPNGTVILRTLDRFAALGLDVEITELDVDVPAPDGVPAPSSLEMQRDRYVEVVSACLAATRCTGVTVWGLHDGRSHEPWRFPVLFDAALQPKPAAIGVRDLVARTSR